MTGSGPPVAPRGPGADPYAWMRDRDQPQLREYLAAERAYYDEQTAPLRALREELFAELAARLRAGRGVGPVAPGRVLVLHRRPWPGQQLEQFCRAAGLDGPGEVLLDENLLLADPAAAGSYAELGVREVSPDGRYLAYSVDFDGDEVYQLRVRDLATGTDLAERIERTYYGLAWAADSRSLLYVVTDPAYRPHEVWRHELGSAPGRDSLVYREDDERFELTVRATRSGSWLLIETASRDTTETLLIPADDTGVAPFVIEPRRPGTEYYADHAAGPDGGELYLVTNAGAAEFRLVRAPVTAPGTAPWSAARWTEVIGAADGTRLVRCDVFGRYLVRGAAPWRRDPAARAGPRDRGAAPDRGGRRGAGAGPGGERGLHHGGGDRADRVTDRAAVLARRGPGQRPVGAAQAPGGTRVRPGRVRDRADQRARRGRHPDPGHRGVPARAAPRRLRAGPAVRLRRVRGVFLAGVQRDHPRACSTAGSCTRWRTFAAAARVAAGGGPRGTWTASAPRSPTSSRPPTCWPARLC